MTIHVWKALLKGFPTPQTADFRIEQVGNGGQRTGSVWKIFDFFPYFHLFFQFRQII